MKPVSLNSNSKIEHPEENTSTNNEARENVFRSNDSIGLSCGSGSGENLSFELGKSAVSFTRQKSNAGITCLYSSFNIHNFMQAS